MPIILEEDAGWSTEAAGLFASLYVMSGIVTSVVFGLMSDRLRRRRNIVILAGLWAAFFVLAVTVGIRADNYRLVALSLPLIGLGIYTGMPVSLALANESVTTDLMGITNGLVFGCGFIVGGVVYPTALGMIKDATGTYLSGFIGITIMTFVMCFFLPFIARDLEREGADA